MTRVLIVDDHPVFRQGIAALLEVAGFDVIGEAAGAREAVELARRLVPDIVIMDLGLPDESGLAATAQITALNPRIHVVVLSLFDDPATVQAAIEAGATGYVVKDAGHDEIIAIIRAAEHGAVALGSGVRDSLAVGERFDSVADVYGLSRREAQVASLMERGLTNQQIAQRLGIATKTVSNLVSSLLAKLGVPDRIAAAAMLRR